MRNEKRSFETLLYSVTPNVVNEIIKKNGWTEDEAMERFAQSKVYSYLEDEKTKVWQYSALMIAELFNEERKGALVFPEV